jgi:hypothetical protein
LTISGGGGEGASAAAAALPSERERIVLLGLSQVPRPAYDAATWIADQLVRYAMRIVAVDDTAAAAAAADRLLVGAAEIASGLGQRDILWNVLYAVMSREARAAAKAGAEANDSAAGAATAGRGASADDGTDDGVGGDAGADGVATSSLERWSSVGGLNDHCNRQFRVRQRELHPLGFQARRGDATEQALLRWGYGHRMCELSRALGDPDDSSGGRSDPLSTLMALAMAGVSVLSCTVTFYANLAHSLTRSP